MKYVILSIVVLMMGASIGCKEDPAKTWVTGRLTIAEKSWSWDEIEGTLETSDGDYYGSCKKSGDDFEFEVGHANAANISGNQFNVKVRAIEGPPEGNTFTSAGQTQDNVDFYTKFGSASLTIGGDNWTIDSSSDECNVILFSKSGKNEQDEDEVEPLGLHDFEYYVHIECTGMYDDVSSIGSSLYTFIAEFYFNNC